MYALNRCAILFAKDEAKIVGPCVQCKETQTIVTKTEGFKSYSQGQLIQNAFPDVSDSNREFMISGICPNCWDKLFGEELN